jgi:signal transduction histidine kinase/ActR/RegA family two-component response regulator
VISKPTIRRSVITVTLVTTAVALLLNALALMLLEARDFRLSRLAQVTAQAEILARASQAAIAFNDRREATNALEILNADPAVLAAAVYLPDKQLFASYTRDGERVPQMANTAQPIEIRGGEIVGFYSTPTLTDTQGFVYLKAHSGHYKRLYQYVSVLAAVMLGAFGIAWLLSTRLQQSVTAPVTEVARAAEKVVDDHDYSVRVAPQQGLETGFLADAFNTMLAEIQKRTDDVNREMRERIQAEEALRETDQNKNRFLAMLAHELRNPLAPIVSAVALLRIDTLSKADHRKARDIIDRQVLRMSRLLDDLLDVGRITNNKLELRKQRVNVNSIIEAAVEATRPAIDAAGHTLEISMAAHDIEIDADSVRMAQVFANLLNNAAKYTTPGGVIKLDAIRAGNTVVIRVQDNGIGFTPEDSQGLFELFAQSPSAAHLSHGGLGVGLFLVRSLTEMHGGTVEACSDGPNTGSCFTVRIPVTPDQFEAQQPLREPTTRLQGKRILVVDDNVDAAEALAMLLRTHGNEVRTCYDGAGALAALDAFETNIAFIDIGMPEMDGYTVARMIRTSARGRSIMLAALTGWGQAADKNSAIEAGFDCHLTKPASFEAMEASFIAYAVARQREPKMVA